MTVGAGLSGVMVLVLEGLISAFGWRSALVIMAAVQLLVCTPLALSMRNRPSELGLLPDNDAWDEGEPPEQQAARYAPEGYTVGQAVRSSSFWKLSIAMMLTNVSTIAIIVHQIPFLTNSVGISEGLAAASVTAMTLLSLIGRLGLGQLADVMDKRHVMALALGVTAVSLLLMATVYEGWQIVYALPFFALGFGGVIPVRPAFQAEYFGMRAFGAIQGLVFTVATLGALAGPVFAGWMYDQTGSYRLAFTILSLGSALAVPLVLTIKRPDWETAGHSAGTPGPHPG
jgi:sugar phosphate permease